jgi:NAD(P)H-quinone oxidoreductase subunit 5
MARTVAFVSAFVLSDHLAVSGVLWIGMSLGMHALLRHFEGRAAARRAAKKKFWFSRVGDVAFWTAVVLLLREGVSLSPSSWTVDTFAGSSAGVAALLLVGTVLLKSAQFPFHSWLPETMEAPTPVSALMHAGVINAGAFLLLRLSPLLVARPAALDLALVAGGLTTALGCLVWWSQPDVKKSLAWSTVAQMGFLMVEIGLGLFHTALLHLLGHALYKAHAFLRSGTLPETRVEENRDDALSSWILPAAATLVFAALLAVASHRWSGGPWDVEFAMVALWTAISFDIARSSRASAPRAQLSSRSPPRTGSRTPGSAGGSRRRRRSSAAAPSRWPSPRSSSPCWDW